MALDVKVSINLTQPAGKAGSWYPLIYVPKTDGEEDKYAEYTRLADIAKDYEVTTDAYKVANLIFMQDNAPDKIAICRGDETVMTGLASYMKKNWRQLIVLAEFDETVATAIEATDKMYFTHFANQTALSTASAKIKDYDRTVAVVYSNTDVTYPEAAVVGATAGMNAGSFTYKNIILKSVAACDLNAAEIEAIHALGGITIVEKAGDTVTSEGISVGGEYIDVIDSKDYIIQNISYKVQKVFNNNAKVPYTNAGIAMLEAATLEALVDGHNNGMIADNDDGTPAYTVSFALRSGTTESDRAARNYPYGQFAFELAGAVHTAEIVGEIQI
jgi:hypothetical protein